MVYSTFGKVIPSNFTFLFTSYSEVWSAFLLIRILINLVILPTSFPASQAALIADKSSSSASYPGVSWNDGFCLSIKPLFQLENGVAS